MGNPKLAALLAIVLLLGLLSAPAAAQEEEEARYKDAPYFSAMPDYSIFDANDKKFDAYDFFNGTDATTVEGQKFFRYYTLKEGAEAASELQIARNYATAIKNMGGTILFDGVCEGDYCGDNAGYRMVVGKVVKGTSELWTEIVPFDDGLGYYLTIVAKGLMTQDVTASAMLEALNKNGRVALYINFDTGKATIRPDSKPIIGEIVQMLKTNKDLELSVEGHTDNVGDAKSNQTLSENRAKAVADALVAQGVDAKRLSTAGHGQDKPIADNSSEEGRAKNRRVELVKKGAAPSAAPSKASSGASIAAAAEERFGVKVYPGAKLDQEQTKNATETMGFEVYCYRTADKLEKVIEFYKGQKGLDLLFSIEDSAIFSASGNVKISVASPWTEPITGKPHTDTFIQIANEGE